MAHKEPVVSEEVLEKGRFAAGEKSSNSIDVSNEAYVGVDDIYKNHAYEDQEPSISDDDDQAEVEKAARAAEDARLVEGPGFRGYDPETVHPSERVKPQEAAIQQQNAVREAMAAQAQAVLDEQSKAADKDSAPSTSPSKP